MKNSIESSNANIAKEIVKLFFAQISDGKIEAAFQLVDDSVTWWVPEELPFSGTKSKTQYLAIVSRITSGFPNGFKLNLISMIAEESTVAAEVESEGVHTNGKPYNNKYHFLMKIRGGKIVEVKEYMNTLHLAKLLQ